MTTGYTIKKLQALRDAVLADGKVDWDETTELLKASRDLAVRHGFAFEDFERQLLKCREDGRITPGESDKLAMLLDYLCSFFANLRLRFWLTAVTILALASAVAFVGLCVIRANRIPLSSETSAPGMEAPVDEGEASE